MDFLSVCSWKTKTKHTATLDLACQSIAKPSWCWQLHCQSPTTAGFSSYNEYPSPPYITRIIALFTACSAYTFSWPLYPTSVLNCLTNIDEANPFLLRFAPVCACMSIPMEVLSAPFCISWLISLLPTFHMCLEVWEKTHVVSERVTVGPDKQIESRIQSFLRLWIQMGFPNECSASAWPFIIHLNLIFLLTKEQNN